jgi:hypothetical protein
MLADSLGPVNTRRNLNPFVDFAESRVEDDGDSPNRGQGRDYWKSITLMAGGIACRACGVVLPKRVGRCPSCGSRSWTWRAPAQVGLGAVIGLVVWSIGPVYRNRVDSSLAGDVRSSGARLQMSSDWKQLEVVGRVENKSQVPVDVVIRVRGKDAGGRVVTVIESEPYRELPPGSLTTVGVTLDTFLANSVELDIVELTRSPK